jgi:uncharacterized radical SAM superfamily Fe-S cluster-containing enzyme
MVIKTIVFTIILKFNGPDGQHGYTQKNYSINLFEIFSKRIKNKKKIGIEEIVQIYVPSL